MPAKTIYESKTLLFDITRSGSANALRMIDSFQAEVDEAQADALPLEFALFIISYFGTIGNEFSTVTTNGMSAAASYLESCEDFWDNLEDDFTASTNALKSCVVEFKYKGTWDTRALCYYWTALVPKIVQRTYI